MADKQVKYIYGSKELVTSRQSAPDNGCYDFWKDVNRIEEKLGNKYGDKIVRKGYVIIISN